SGLSADGVPPSNEGRGYVQSRDSRRALRHVWKLDGLHADGRLSRIVWPPVEPNGQADQELAAREVLARPTLVAEEAAFAQTLEAGMARLQEYLAASGNRTGGEQLFQSHDTYGCPPDLIADLVRENADKGWALAGGALAAYEAHMERQRERGRAA